MCCVLTNHGRHHVEPGLQTASTLAHDAAVAVQTPGMLTEVRYANTSHNTTDYQLVGKSLLVHHDYLGVLMLLKCSHKSDEHT